MKKLLITLFCLAAVGAATSRAAAPAPAVAALGSYAQSLQAPGRVATDAAGNVYASDPQAGNVVVFDAFGRVRSIHGGFAGPVGVAVDAPGRIYIAEEQAGRVSVFNAAWGFLYALGVGDGEFVQPNHIAIDAANGNVYVTDSAANEVKVYVGSGLSNRFGSAGTADGQFMFPAGICVSAAGEVFVVDQGNDRVEVFNRSGAFLRSFRLKTGGMALGPTGRGQAALLDNAGRLYVADAFQGFVKVFDAAAGTYLGRVGAYGEGAGQLLSPVGLALDPYNRLFVASSNSGRIELFGLDSYLHFTMVPVGGTIGLGTRLVFTVIAGGSGPFSYQWQKDGANLDGETGGTLTIGSAGLGNSGSYSVAVTGPSGPVTSSATQVTVLELPTITTPSPLADGTRGVAYSQALAASGGATPYAWSVSAGALPNGLTLAGDGTISGVPMDGGAFNFTAQVSDGNNLTATQALALTIQTTPFDDWRVSQFGVTELADLAISGETADPDGDGLTNLQEFALNCDPKNADNPSMLTTPLNVIASAPILGTDGQPLPGSNPDAGASGFPVIPGCLVQIIDAGANGVADPPDANGNPTGDDTVFATTAIGVGVAPEITVSGKFSALFDPPPADGTKVYARAFNAPDTASATRYGQSTPFTVAGTAVFDVSALGLVAAAQPLRPLTLASVVSRKVHGGAGTFDLSLSLDLTAKPTVEPRLGGPTTLVFAFSDNIAAADGAISANEFILANAAFSAASISGNTLTLNLTGVVDQSVVTVALQGIVDLLGVPLTGSGVVQVIALCGDVNQSGTVNAVDLQFVKNRLLQAANAGNYLADVNFNGAINAPDLQQVKNNLLHSVTLASPAPVASGESATPSGSSFSAAAALSAVWLGDALGAPELPWTTYGDQVWVPTTMADGTPAALSGRISDYQVSWIETTVTGPGVISFDWKVSSELNADFLTFSMDGVDQPGRISGEVDWQRVSYSIPSGTHLLRWTYGKNNSGSAGLDAGWVRKVTYTRP